MDTPEALRRLSQVRRSMSLIAIFAVLLFTGCLLFIAGVGVRIGYARRNRGCQPLLNLLILTLVIVALSPVLNAKPIHADAPDVTDQVQILNNRTAISYFGPSIFGLHAHFRTPLSGRVFLSSVGTRGFLASRTYQRDPTGRAPYPALWYHGQPIGLDRWFSDAIASVKASFVLLC
jgi:hypothetical protein